MSISQFEPVDKAEFKKIPVVLFNFNRPALTRSVLEAIRNYRPERLFLVCDGARQDTPSDFVSVALVKEELSRIDWECEVTRIYAEENMGLKARFYTGLDEVFNQVEKAMILEDDCVPSASFFRFAEAALNLYQERSDIGTVAGTNHLDESPSGADSFLSKHPQIWGWGTWDREWKAFASSGYREHVPLAAQIRVLWGIDSIIGRIFFLNLLIQRKRLNTWDIDFALFERTKRQKAVTPPRNLVQNQGFGNGTHRALFEDADSVKAQELSHFHLPVDISIWALFEKRSNRRRLVQMLKATVRFAMRSANRRLN